MNVFLLFNCIVSAVIYPPLSLTAAVLSDVYSCENVMDCFNFKHEKQPSWDTQYEVFLLAAFPVWFIKLLTIFDGFRVEAASLTLSSDLSHTSSPECLAAVSVQGSL